MACQVRSSLASGRTDEQEPFWSDVINKVLLPLSSSSDTPQQKLVGVAAIGMSDEFFSLLIRTSR
jgi:hypothetical protein